MTFSKVLVANRGAIARRVIRTCSGLGLQTVAVYSDPDEDAPYLAEASQAVRMPGVHASDTYLNQDLLLGLARDVGADSIHPGYGFLAENAEFAARVRAQEMTFIGPATKWLTAMGDKVAARQLLAAEDFPMFSGSGVVADLATAQSQAEALGYPVMLKPSGGGGGMGMEVVADAEHLQAAMQRAQAIAGRAFGDSTLYLERWIANPRHIEFQVLGDGEGNAMHLFERECSVQRRNQKLIEESPAPNLSTTMLMQRAEQAAAVCAKLGYDNLGTLETLVDADGNMGFLEMNTRIQVEHGVTEMVTGLDLVQQQLQLAAGGSLPEPPQRQGFAMEARLYAEDPQTFLPSTGKLWRFHIPSLQGVRVETGYQQGQQVTPYYDAMLAKVIAWGATREMAIGRLLVALRAIEIAGVKTNTALLMQVLQDEEFLAGEIDTGIVGRVLGGP